MNKEKKELPGDLKLSSQEIELYVTNADFERIKSHAVVRTFKGVGDRPETQIGGR